MTNPDAPRDAPRRSKADVVAAAVRLLNELGLPGLSMRALAHSLDVQASALYWHFPNKQSILAAISDVLQAPAIDGGDDVVAAALRVRDALAGTNDGAEIVASTLSLGLGERHPATPIAAALERAGVPADEAVVSAGVIATYLLGHTEHWQQRRMAERIGLVDASPVDERTEFEAGLARLLTGITPR